jgi:hypothetical protein
MHAANGTSFAKWRQDQVKAANDLKNTWMEPHWFMHRSGYGTTDENRSENGHA